MHSTELMQAADFRFFHDGQPVTLADAVPGLGMLDRLGIVMAGPLDGIGAGNFIMACVTAFYDTYRARGEDFFTYPDYFTFQASETTAKYGGFDIWPDHKNVQVARDAEQILQAINDRGITLLLVPDVPPVQHNFSRVALSSAQRRIRLCYVYAPDGRVAEPDLQIRFPGAPMVKWVQSIFKSATDAGLGYAMQTQWAARQKGKEFTEETYRRVPLDEALARLPREATPGDGMATRSRWEKDAGMEANGHDEQARGRM